MMLPSAVQYVSIRRACTELASGWRLVYHSVGCVPKQGIYQYGGCLKCAREQGIPMIPPPPYVPQTTVCRLVVLLSHVRAQSHDMTGIDYCSSHKHYTDLARTTSISLTHMAPVLILLCKFRATPRALERHVGRTCLVGLVWCHCETRKALCLAHACHSIIAIYLSAL